jgi:RNA polymerase sigma-70 factor (ECF subfamily)
MVNDDAELLQRIRHGAPDDFAEIVRRHQALVFAILHRYERDFQKVEDLAQDTFVKAWRFLDQYDGRAPLQHWISKIALRVALDHLRREKRVRAELALSSLGEDALDWLRDPGEERQIAPRQAAELLDLAMRELSPEDRQVITLLEIEGRSVKEICELTDSSSDKIRTEKMNDKKLKQLFGLAGKEAPPTPPEGFDVCVAQSLRRQSPLESVSLWEQLEKLFPRVAIASLLVAGVCMLGDFARTSPELSTDLDNLSAQWIFASSPN